VNIFATLAHAARIGGGGDASTVAIIVPLVARFLPGMVAGMLGGVVADRWNRKVTMVVSDFGRAVLVGSLLFVSTLSQLFLIIVLVELLGLFRQPAREAVVPTLIASRHLAAANGLNLVSMYGTAPIGSALFALLTEFSELLPEISQTCDRLLILDDGEIVASGTEEELGEMLLRTRRLAVTIRIEDGKGVNGSADGAIRRARAVMEGVSGVTVVRQPRRGKGAIEERGAATFEVEGDSDLRSEVCRALVENGCEVIGLARAERELERVFVGLVGQERA